MRMKLLRTEACNQNGKSGFAFIGVLPLKWCVVARVFRLSTWRTNGRDGGGCVTRTVDTGLRTIDSVPIDRRAVPLWEVSPMPNPDSPVMFSPAEAAAVAENTLAHKALNHPVRAFMLSLSGGGYIALGFVFFTTSQVGTSEVLGYGVARVIGGPVFSVGLALVVLTGAELFTSTAMTLVARASGLITWSRLFMH